MFKKFFNARVAVAVFTALALAFFSASPIVAAEGVNYYFTGDSLHGTTLNISGYFYNDSDQTKYIKSITFRGNNVGFQQNFSVNMLIKPKNRIYRSYSVNIPRTNLRIIQYGVVVTSQ